MKEKREFNQCIKFLLVSFTLLCMSMTVTVAQQPQETPSGRGGESDAFKKVEANSVIRNRRPGKSAQTRLYRTSREFPDGGRNTFVTVGVTVGRGKLATDTEINDSNVAKVKGCVQWEDKKCVSRKEMVLARISDDSAVSDKEQIQMTVEYLASPDASGNTQSNRIGYLYVINREQYPDGTYSKPKLIFPTLNTYYGDNRVLPGKTVAMPEPERPWTISRSDSVIAQAFETYTIIVSPEPLKELSGREIKLQTKPIMLDEKLVATWVRLWGGSETRGDLENGGGQLITQREVKSSGSLGVRKRSTDDDVDDLKQDDPPPQMIFRKIVKLGGKMLVTIRLPYKEASASSQMPKQ